MEIKTNEIAIIGKWLFENNQIVENDNCKRINYLINNRLQKLLTSPSGWETLYLNPSDNRHWELNYLESELSGGGPPSLLYISNEDVLKKYDIKIRQ